MIPRSFEYFAPSSLEEAVGVLEKFGGEAKVLAGGQSLIPLMKLRIASPQVLVDIGRIQGLEYIKRDAGIRIGAMTRMAEIHDSALLEESYRLIPEAASVIADPIVRNWGTIGGNLSHADPANDMPAVVLATGGELVAVGPAGERVIPVEGFFVDTFTTALQANEVLREIRLPSPLPKTGSAYVKLERQAGDFAIAGVAAVVRIDGDGSIASAGIGLTAVGPTTIKARAAEQELIGKRPTDAVIKEAATRASAASNPVGDIRGSADYKREMVRVISERALVIAKRRAVEG